MFFIKIIIIATAFIPFTHWNEPLYSYQMHYNFGLKWAKMRLVALQPPKMEACTLSILSDEWKYTSQTRKSNKIR